ncbi:MAG TPA: cyclase family protein [Ktedonobacteraceae bacterium]|jgi:arylformamidase|nr:cyclase family protein [Ktedonobacteraceae bacterium]
MAGDWIDVSVPLHSGMVHWPDNPPVSIERVLDMSRGDAANVSKLSMGAHTGTHMDAPVHFFPDGKGIDTMPITAVIGQARVIEIADPESIKPDELRARQIQAGERVLFKTRNSSRCWQVDEFVKEFVYISAEAAQYLAEQKIQAVGVDYLSVGGFFKDGAATHHALLGAGIWIIEGLNLTNVQPGLVELICLPIKIVGSDGAPARAILRPLS